MRLYRTPLWTMLAVSASLLALPADGVAQAGPLRELSPVVVTATLLPATEAAVNQHVSIFTREQIEREAPAGLADFLSRRAGIVTDRLAGSGGYGALFLRGADPSHVVVLIDGIRQNDPLSSRGSAVDLNTLTFDDVERIEVVRGSASVAHPEALAGVVQIFTRAPREGMKAGIEAGGQGLRAAHASFAHGPWQAGVSQRESGKDDGDGFNRTRSANLGFRQQWGATRMQAALRLTDSDNRGFPDDSGGPAHAVNRALERRESDAQQLAVALERELKPDSTIELRATRFQRSSFQDTPRVAPGIRDPAGLPPIVSDADYDRNEFQLHWRGGIAGWETLLGLDSQSEDGSLASTIFLGRRIPARFHIHRITNSAVGEARRSIGPWSMQFGLRHERTPGNASLQHPAMSVQYQPTEHGGRVGAALSSAGKLPSFYALGHPLVGNPQLKPERSRQAEVYYASGDASPWNTRITLFHARYRDLVDFDAGPPPRLVNRASIRSTGLEFSMRREWRHGLRTYAQGTLMNITDPNGGPPLRSRPRKQASIGIEAPVAPHWRAQSSLTYIGRRFDSSIPTGDAWLGGYTALNASLTWLGASWQAFAAIDNILDHRAEEIVGESILRRRLRAGLRWSF